MITTELTGKNAQTEQEEALRTFISKMNAAENSVQEKGYYSEEEVEEELNKI